MNCLYMASLGKNIKSVHKGCVQRVRSSSRWGLIRQGNEQLIEYLSRNRLVILHLDLCIVPMGSE